ncbi:methyltransferase domain-containing protein [Saccharothrix sp. 6-C]|uniref:class I SAM-dependent methyltransferase n=1 Tax=Saccharothrix sp. 6-C TaxID=2781735 RepID=UPI00191775CF|nr:methyltransferase domain-containing protein [Saccharothrix sp. 6-C]QQQ77690.1 methyltransferase domain-containing protein [Saccharothrix sp. 6-C]
MANNLMKALDAAFGHPRGKVGELGGRVMAVLNAKVEEHVTEVAAPTSEEVVLVLGPGPGVGLRLAGERALKAIGVDPSQVMLDEARERCAELIVAGRVELREGAATRTGQPAGSVDVVVSVNNLQLWGNRPAAFHELFRVLRPGGRLVVSVHRRALDTSEYDLIQEAEAAGFTGVRTSLHQHGGVVGPAVQLLAHVPA